MAGRERARLTGARAPRADEGSGHPADARVFASYLQDSREWMLHTSFNVQKMRLHRCGVCTDATELMDRSREERLVHVFDELSSEVLEEYDGVPLQDGDPSTYWGFVIRLVQPEIVVLDARGRQVDVVPATTRVTDLMVGEYEGEWWLDYWRDVDAEGA